MKILQIIPTLGIGGAEKMMYNLSCELKKNKHEVIVVFFNKNTSFLYEKLINNGIKVIQIKKKRGFSLTALIKLKRIIKDEKPNIIHTHLHVLTYVWLISGKNKIIHTLHTVASKEQSGVGKLICKLIYKYSKKCTPVAISKSVKESFDKEFRYSFNIPIIENGIPINKIEKKESYYFKNVINIFHVGSLIPVKNHKLMINAMKKLINKYKQIELHFFGEGYLLEELKKMTIEEKIEGNIIFEGVKSNINEILYQGDIFLLPSQYEGVPLSLLEAMAAGLPCIASDVGGVSDIIENNVDGILIKANIDNIFKSIEKLINNYNLRVKIGKNAIVKANKYSSEIMTRKYIEVYTNEERKKIND